MGEADENPYFCLGLLSFALRRRKVVEVSGNIGPVLRLL